MKNRLGPNVIPVVEYLGHQPAYGYGWLAVFANYLGGIAIGRGTFPADLVGGPDKEPHKEWLAAKKAGAYTPWQRCHRRVLEEQFAVF